MSEVCPFCHTEIPDGAIVCRGCGANKRPAANLGTIIAPLLGLFGAASLVGNGRYGWAFLVAAVCVFLIRFIYRRAQQAVWARQLQ
jgi:hypothetical protein